MLYNGFTDEGAKRLLNAIKAYENRKYLQIRNEWKNFKRNTNWIKSFAKEKRSEERKKEEEEEGMRNQNYWYIFLFYNMIKYVIFKP